MHWSATDIDIGHRKWNLLPAFVLCLMRILNKKIRLALMHISLCKLLNETVRERLEGFAVLIKNISVGESEVLM